MKTTQVFLDVDGVVFNFDEIFVQVVNKMYNRSLPSNYVPTDWLWNDHPASLTEEECTKAFEEFVKMDGFGVQNPYKEAVEFIHKIKSFSHIDLVTHIPEECVQSRINNFKKNNIHFDRIFAAGEKAKCINEIKHNDKKRYIFIDDKFENCVDVATNVENIEAYLIDRPYNKNFNHEKIFRIKSLHDIKF